MSKSDEQFVQAICQQLDHSLLQIDDAFKSRLDAVRQSAMQAKTVTDAQLDDELLVDHVLIALEDEQQPAYIEKRLDAARAQALSRHSEQGAPKQLGFLRHWRNKFAGLSFSLTASMVATACILVTVVSLVYVGSNSNNNLSVDEELSMMASADDLELYENLDFYLWLDENGFAN